MKSSSKVIFFIIGLAAGTGASFLVFNLMNTNSDSVKMEPEEDPGTKAMNDSTESLPEKNSGNEKSTVKETSLIKIQTDPEEEYEHIDKNSPAYDSLLQVMKSPETEFVAGEEVIRKEEMIALKEVKFIKKTGGKKIKTDSVLAENINLKVEESPDAYTIEFWVSPLNSKGYRMGKNKLALYGIDPITDLLLYQIEEGIFLKAGKIYYRIEKSAEFRPLRPVTDRMIIQNIEN